MNSLPPGLETALQVKIIYISKEILSPFFGLADSENRLIYIREDLPPKVKDFIQLHEFYHLKDRARNWVWREIKANASGALKSPLGFISCVLLSCTGERLGLYWRRIKKGE